MKIFFPLQVFYPSQSGGTANVVYWLAKALLGRGIEPTVVATDMGIDPEFLRNQWIENEAGKVIYLKTHFADFPLHQIVVSLRNFYRADIVHLSSVFFPTCFLMAFVARLFKKKIIWSVHGELDDSALQYSSFKKRPILWCIKKIVRRNAVFHSTSYRETRSIKTHLGDDAKIVHLPNYIEIPPKIYCSPEKYLLFIGRLHPIKAIENLIKALSLSEAFSKSGYILKIAGSASANYKLELQRLVSDLLLGDKIEFLGQIEGEEKQKLYAGAHFTILPSHTENFGLAVVESLAQNTPVLASKGTPWEVLEREKIGFWVDNSPEELACCIDSIFHLKDIEYKEYRERSREFVIREFDIAENIDKWIDVYETV